MKGLYNKFVVWKNSEQITDCFVLRPERDNVAKSALRTYAFATDNIDLSNDLLQWIFEIEESEGE